MASVALHATPIATDADGLDHLVCCHSDGHMAFCGRDVTHEPWVEDGPHPCVVCHDLADAAQSDDGELICPMTGQFCPKPAEDA